MNCHNEGGERADADPQRSDDVSVMHRVLVPADQTRQRVGELVRVPDFDAVGVEPGFDPLAEHPVAPAVEAVGLGHLSHPHGRLPLQHRLVVAARPRQPQELALPTHAELGAVELDQAAADLNRQTPLFF